jgi:hypothetical protein
MKIINSIGLITGLLTATLCFTACGQPNKPTETITSKSAGNGFAVLELFTSEGCSSCPPADEILAQIQQESKGKPVYILAYHVDYWNRLGWKDVFSMAEFSKRQRQYGAWLNAEIYTPQLIINGKHEFVGSDRSAIRNSIANELSTEPVATLALSASQGADGLTVHYQAGNKIKDSRLLIAVVQKNAQSNVLRGENAGHKLSHVQVVRQLQNEVLNAAGEGNVVVALPQGFNTQGWEVLGLIQDPATGKITAAAKAEFNDGVIVKK